MSRGVQHLPAMLRCKRRAMNVPAFRRWARGLRPAPHVESRPLVLELVAVEAFRRAFLPRLAGIDQGHIEILAGGPAQQGPGNELRAVVGTQNLRSTVNADQLGQHFHDPG